MDSSDVLFYLAVVTLVAVTASVLILEHGKRSIKQLRDIAPNETLAFPKISVIIPARNEERNLEEALISVLTQDYRDFEVLVVNDRSTDGTKSIVDRLQEQYAQLRVFHIDKLPVGWLGKNHALHHGALQADGQLLLFSDADVVMEKTVLKRAVSYMHENGLDHLVIAAHLRIEGAVLHMMILAFATSFMLFFMPWKAKNPKSARFTGGGAFSMFYREVYSAIGTMRVLATAIDDDLRLGEEIKKCGFRQELVAGADMVFVEWYSSVKEMVNGLTKNTFAVLGFSLIRTTALALLTFVYYLWPLLALVLTSGSTHLLNISIVAGTLLLYWRSATFVQQSPWYALGFPLAISINLLILFRSALRALLQGGLIWRGTFYPLAELKNK